MKKSLTMMAGGAIAMLAALPAAQAQSGLQTTLYGIANAQFEYVDATGAAVPAQDKPGRYRISNVSSELGIKASLPLPNGITGLVQYTTGISVDNGNGSTSAGMFGSAKDVFVGISFADVGTIKLGRMTAAARWNSGTADFSPMGAGLQDNQGMLSGNSGQSVTGPQFNSRFDNTLGFESVRYKGLSARAYFSANENKSAAGTANSPHLNDISYSLGLQYVSGPFDLRLSHEVRNDKGTLNGTTDRNTRDRDLRFGMRYALSTATTLALGYDRMNMSDPKATGTAKTRLSKTGVVLGAKHVAGAHVVYGGYGVGSDVKCSFGNGSTCNGADTGARNAVIAYQYVFDKQLLAETFVAMIKNEARARYDFDAGGVGPATGSDSRAVGAGLRYAF